MRKTLVGIENKYVVNLPGGKDADLDNISADIFISNSDTFEFMYQNAKSKISEMMDWCEQKIKEDFKSDPQVDQNHLPTLDSNDEPEFQFVDFGNGQVGKIKIKEV